jgi:XTP/dITP diphosphohydrolase
MPGKYNNNNNTNSNTNTTNTTNTTDITTNFNNISVNSNFKSLLLATTNPGKTGEFRLLLSPLLTRLSTTLITLADLKESEHTFPEPLEDGETFQANATIKALHYSRLTNLPTIADDTGLVIEALNGRPGVHSNRFGGVNFTDKDKNLKILELMAREANRSAYFATSLVLAKPGSLATLSFNGQLNGTIAFTLEGTGGFGYDPIFCPTGYTDTLAQMLSDQKNAISHRRQALEAMVADLVNVQEFLSSRKMKDLTKSTKSTKSMRV